MFNAHSNSGALRARKRSPIPNKCGNLPVQEFWSPRDRTSDRPTDRPPVHTNDVRKVKERVCTIEWSFLCPQMQLWLTLKPKIGKNKKKPQYSKPIFSLTTLIFAKCQGLRIPEIFAWGIRNPKTTGKESVAYGLESRIQYCFGFPIMGIMGWVILFS